MRARCLGSPTTGLRVARARPATRSRLRRTSSFGGARGGWLLVLSGALASGGACVFPEYTLNGTGGGGTGGAAGTTLTTGGTGGVTGGTGGATGGTGGVTGGTGGVTTTGGTGGVTGGTGGATGGTGGMTTMPPCLLPGCTQWVQTYGGTGVNEANALLMESNDHTVLGGAFSGQIQWSPGQVDEAAALLDGFALHADSAGVFGHREIFEDFPGTVRDQRVKAVVVGAGGSTVIAGEFAGTMSLDPATKVTAHGGADVDCFVAAYSSNGALVWFTSYGSTGPDTVDGMALDAAGEVVIAGTYSGTLEYSGGSVTLAVPLGAPDIYVMRLIQTNNPVTTVQRCASAGIDRVGGVATDSTGVWVVGLGSSTLGCDNGPSMVSQGGEDMMVIRFPDSAAAFIKQFGGPGDQVARAVSAAPGGGVYVAGDFDGTINVGGSMMMATPGSRDAFWIRLDGQGNVVRSRQIQGTGLGDEMALAVSSTGGFALAGNFTGAVDFGSGAPVQAAGIDAYVIRYDAMDNYLWQRVIGGADPQRIRGLAFDSTGAAVVAGDFLGPTDFGLGSVTPAIGARDVFLAKLHP